MRASLLARAQAAARRGQRIECGVLLREAVRTSLVDLTAAAGVLPRRPYSHRRPLVLANVAWQAGLLSHVEVRQIRDAIEIGNAAAHCFPVDPQRLQLAVDSITELFAGRTVQ